MVFICDQIRLLLESNIFREQNMLGWFILCCWVEGNRNTEVQFTALGKYIGVTSFTKCLQSLDNLLSKSSSCPRLLWVKLKYSAFTKDWQYLRNKLPDVFSVIHYTSLEQSSFRKPNQVFIYTEESVVLRLSSRMWLRIVWYMFTTVSEKPTAILRIGEGVRT